MEETKDNSLEIKDDKGWYVLYHLNPNIVEVMLRKDCNGEFQEEGTKLPPYQYYIPFKYMPIIKEAKHDETVDDKKYDPSKDQNALRNDLHSFVFIQASHKRVEAIVRSDWNRQARLHLYWYRDTDGREVRLPDAEMQMLIKTIQDRHLKFYLDQPLDEFNVGDKVILQQEPWKGKTAEVRDIRLKKGRILLAVSINILGRTKSITFRDISVGDVRFVDEERGRMLTGNPVTNYEEEIIDLLSHRFTQNASESLKKSDDERLKRLASYVRIYIEEPAEKVRFQALQLLCCYLRSDKKHVEEKTAELQQQLGDRTTVEGPEDAYRMLALFVVTRAPWLRDAVKEYRKEHAEAPDVFRRYLSILKNLKTRK